MKNLKLSFAAIVLIAICSAFATKPVVKISTTYRVDHSDLVSSSPDVYKIFINGEAEETYECDNGGDFCTLTVDPSIVSPDGNDGIFDFYYSNTAGVSKEEGTYPTK